LLSIVPHVVEQAGRHAGLQQRASGMDGADSVKDLRPGSALEQIAARAGAQCAQDALVGIVGGEDYGAGFRPGFPKPFQGSDTVYPGHLEVEQDHVGL
jgi:hypothetical protein